MQGSVTLTELFPRTQWHWLCLCPLPWCWAPSQRAWPLPLALTFQIPGGIDKSPSQPSFVQDKQAQPPQPFSTGEMLQSPHHLHSPALNLLQQLLVSPDLRSPEPALPFSSFPSGAGGLKSRHFFPVWQQLIAGEFGQFLPSCGSRCDLSGSAVQGNEMMQREHFCAAGGEAHPLEGISEHSELRVTCKSRTVIATPQSYSSH